MTWRISENFRKNWERKVSNLKKEKCWVKNFPFCVLLNSNDVVLSLQHDFKSIKNCNKTTKFFRKPVISTPLNSMAFNGRQKVRQTIPQWEKKWCWSIKSNQRNITISLMIMKTTTNTCKNQKIMRELKEQIFEAIETIIVSLKTLSIIHWTCFLSQWELLMMG